MFSPESFNFPVQKFRTLHFREQWYRTLSRAFLVRTGVSVCVVLTTHSKRSVMFSVTVPECPHQGGFCPKMTRYWFCGEEQAVLAQSFWMTKSEAAGMRGQGHGDYLFLPNTREDQVKILAVHFSSARASAASSVKSFESSRRIVIGYLPGYGPPRSAVRAPMHRPQRKSRGRYLPVIDRFSRRPLFPSKNNG